jgi:TPR repeat protein
MNGLVDRAASEKRTAGTNVAEQMAVAFEASQKGDYETALSIWGPLAQQGVGRAQNNVGACFAEGLGRRPGSWRWRSSGLTAFSRRAATRWASATWPPRFTSRARASSRIIPRVPRSFTAQAAEQGDAAGAGHALSWMLLEGEVMPADQADSKRANGRSWLLRKGVSPRR